MTSGGREAQATVKLPGQLCSCPLSFFPYSLFSSSPVSMFLCLTSFLLFPCASVWENTHAVFSQRERLWDLQAVLLNSTINKLTCRWLVTIRQSIYKCFALLARIVLVSSPCELWANTTIVTNGDNGKLRRQNMQNTAYTKSISMANLPQRTLLLEAVRNYNLTKPIINLQLITWGIHNFFDYECLV